MENITVTQVSTHLGADTLLLDVREAWEYELCHIDGSLNLPMAEINTRIAELSVEAEIVVICHHGMRSLQVAQFLSDHGFQHIKNMQGGIDAWALEIDSNMPRY